MARGTLSNTGLVPGRWQEAVVIASKYADGATFAVCSRELRGELPHEISSAITGRRRASKQHPFDQAFAARRASDALRGLRPAFHRSCMFRKRKILDSAPLERRASPKLYGLINQGLTRRSGATLWTLKTERFAASAPSPSAVWQ
jgi:hypothetical protein